MLNSNTLSKSLILAVSALAVAACDDDNQNNKQSAISFIPTNLENLGDDYEYEGWLITDNGAIATGKFDIDPNNNEAEQTFIVNKADADAAKAFVLTIEPAEEEGDDIAAPSDVHIIAGDIINNTAIATTSHPAALGTDFSNAMAKYILATPTNGNATPTQGIWFLDNSSGSPVAGLTLPTLPKGWLYEGWIVENDNGSIIANSTGTFLNGNGADSDGAGDAAGNMAAPPFPGQDYVNPPKDLVNTTAVISVEPDPDNSPAPFSIKPLIGTITNTGGVMSLDNKSAESLPSATISISTYY